MKDSLRILGKRYYNLAGSFDENETSELLQSVMDQVINNVAVLTIRDPSNNLWLFREALGWKELINNQHTKSR